DAESILQRRRDLLLVHEPSQVRQGIADAVGEERGGVALHLLADAAGHRALVAFPTGLSIEERAQSRLGLEDAVEDDLAPVELVSLGLVEPGQRLARLGGLRARRPEQERDYRERREQPIHCAPCGAGRGRTSIVFTTFPPGARTYSTRTRSPLLIWAISAPAAPAAAALTVGAAVHESFTPRRA